MSVLLAPLRGLAAAQETACQLPDVQDEAHQHHEHDGKSDGRNNENHVVTSARNYTNLSLESQSRTVHNRIDCSVGIAAWFFVVPV
jgi:stress-induced morphogen